MGNGTISKGMKETLAKAAVYDLFGEEAALLEKRALEDIARIFDACWSDFDWAAAERVRDYIRWSNDFAFLYWLPEEWKNHVSYKAELYRLLKVSKLRHIELPKQYPVPMCGYYKPPDYAVREMLNAARPFMECVFKAEKAYKDICSTLTAVSTYKQLEETIPELAKFITKTSPANVLVPIEQINRVRNMFHQKAEGAA